MMTSQVRVKHLLSCIVDHDLGKKVRVESGLSHGPSSNPKDYSTVVNVPRVLEKDRQKRRFQ